ncbi:hypothetical protein F5Y04DRAFT_286813 [Hypomontagnella monticulosa]|nr:hypothetical protein F5Y04DRAFT_286813 [Hypomontagnella monticulosa]
MPNDNGVRARAGSPTPDEAAPGTHQTTQAHDNANGHNTQNPAIVDMNAVMNQFGGLGINGVPPIPGMIPMATADGRIVHVAANYPAHAVPAPGIPAHGVAAFGYPPQAEAYPAPYGPYGPYAAPAGAPYLSAPAGYQHHPVYAISPYTPGRTGIAHERSDTGSRDVPALDIRRSSYSTNESTPATPFLGSMSSRDQGARVTVFDRSTYTTPSPQQIMPADPLQEPKSPLLDREPKIPFAVPAVFTPPENMKTLEQSLVNTIPGNCNVYIRGLHPNTDDALLLKYAERFGTVDTSKAIIDSNTGACKGFGFAKFHDVRDSEKCIRGFYRRGYEVGFARVPSPRPRRGQAQQRRREQRADYLNDQESFNSRLRAEADDTSTNLYLSNLPKTYGEAEINTIFQGFTILSSKVLRDNLGNSRGVGFARFESREICDQIIAEFTGLNIGRERLPLQIRYADTPAQKDLKRVTAERRQWRTNEYNVSAYGTPLVGMNPAHCFTYQHNGGGHSVTSQGNAGGFVPGPRESVEIRVDSPLVAHGSNPSSPAKQEKE